MKHKSKNKHTSLAAIKQYLSTGTYPSGSTPSDKRSVRKRSESFKVLDGELFYVTVPKCPDDELPDPDPGSNKANLRKVVISPRDQLACVSQIHITPNGTHMGVERTLQSVSSHYYWLGMANSVKDLIKKCAVCLANRPATSALPSAPTTKVKEQEPQNREAEVFKVSEDQGQTPTDQMNTSQGGDTEAKEEDPNVSYLESMQYMVTSELEDPENQDSDLDLDAGSVFPVSNIFNETADYAAASRFWQKVDVFVIGPLPHKRKQSYVIAAMDQFSKWPELQVVEKCNEKFAAQFLIKLIARYGVMEQIMLLTRENEPEALDTEGMVQNLQHFNVSVIPESYNPVDESWCRLVQTVTRFAEQYSEFWHHCLDLCLIPLRNSLTREADFTASYLLMKREPVFPESIIPEKGDGGEITMSQEQIEQSVSTAVLHYLGCVVPDVKKSEMPVRDRAAEVQMSVRKSGRRPKRSYRLSSFHDSKENDTEPDEEWRPKSSQEVPPKKKFAMEPPGKQNPSVKEGGIDKLQISTKLEQSEAGDKALFAEFDKFELDLDTVYAVIQLYIEKDEFPPNSSKAFKSLVQKSTQLYQSKEGILTVELRGKQYKVVNTMEDRLALLDEAHVVKGDHLSKGKTMEALVEKQVMWRDMNSDVEAYVKACPQCKYGAPRKSKTSTPKARSWLRETLGAEGDSDDENMESVNLGKISYSELVDYLRKDIIPDGLSRSELLIFRKKAKHYKLDKGVLYINVPGKKGPVPKRILKTETERLAAIEDAQKKHKTHADILTSLREKCFWHGMETDVKKALSTDSVQVSEKENGVTEGGENDTDPSLSDPRVKKFQDYFAGINICPPKENLEHLFEEIEPTEEESSVVEEPRPAPSAKKDLVAEAMQSAMLGSESEISELSEERQEEESETSTAVPNVDTTSSMHVDENVKGENSIASQESVPITIGPNNTKLEIIDPSNSVLPPKEDENAEAVERNEGEVLANLDESWKVDNVDIQAPEEKAIIKKSKPVGVRAKKSNSRARCPMCHEVITGENNFREHMYKHTGVKPFQCNICPKKFTTIKGMRMHSRRHTGNPPYLCNICGRSFPRSASLKYHIKNHDRGGGVPVECDICHRTFTTENRLEKHKSFKHPSETPVYGCQQCGRKFTAKRSLKRHEEAHQGIRKYVCQFCSRGFFRKEYLNYHLVSHSNEDPSLLNYKLKGRQRRQHAAAQKKEELFSIVCLDSRNGEISRDEEVYGHLVEVADPSEWSQVTGRLEGEQVPTVYELEGGQRVITTDSHMEPGTTVVMVEEQSTNAQGQMEVRHIIMPDATEHLVAASAAQLQQPESSKPTQTIAIHHHDPSELSHQSLDQPQQSIISEAIEPKEELQHLEVEAVHQVQTQNPNGSLCSRSIELTLPTGTKHTISLPADATTLMDSSGQETVQYQVECLSGDPLTEADFNAIRMLAQASLGGAHIVQQ